LFKIYVFALKWGYWVITSYIDKSFSKASPWDPFIGIWIIKTGQSVQKLCHFKEKNDPLFVWKVNIAPLNLVTVRCIWYFYRSFHGFYLYFLRVSTRHQCLARYSLHLVIKLSTNSKIVSFSPRSSSYVSFSLVWTFSSPIWLITSSNLAFVSSIFSNEFWTSAVTCC